MTARDDARDDDDARRLEAGARALEAALTVDDDPLRSGASDVERRRPASARRGRGARALDASEWVAKFGVARRGGCDGRVGTRATGATEATRAATAGGGGGEGGTTTTSGRLGLVAKERVRACEVLIRERVTSIQGTFRSQGACLARLMERLRERGEQDASRACAPSREMAKKLLSNAEEREEVLALGAKLGVEDEEEWLKFAAFVKYNAVTRTCRPATTSAGSMIGADAYVQCSMVMFDAISACNHSCDPNAEVSHVSDEGEVSLYSLRPIERGEEITIAYGKPSLRWLPARCRKKALRRDWYFDCACAQCKAEVASGLAVDKPLARPWDIQDPRWFFCTHDYVTGFESHFDGEGNLLSLKSATASRSNVSPSASGANTSESAADGVAAEFGAKLHVGGLGLAADASGSSSGLCDSSDSSSCQSVDLDEYDRESSGSEDEDVLRWHERWRSKRIKAYSVKNVGLYTPLQLYHAMQRCQIRQDHWQLLVVREALISQIMNDAAMKGNASSSRPNAPSLDGGWGERGKFQAFKLILNQCRSLARMAPNTGSFAELFATLENIVYWWSTDGWHYVSTKRERREQERAFSRARARRARNGAGETARESDRSDSVDDDEFFEIPVRSRWAFRLERLRDAAHADVLAWNMQFGKLPSAPF